MGEFTHKFSHPGSPDRLGGRRQRVCNTKAEAETGRPPQNGGQLPGHLGSIVWVPCPWQPQPSHCSECRAKQHPSGVSKRQGFWALCFHLGPNSEAAAGTTRQLGDGGGPLCKGIMPSTARPGPHGTVCDQFNRRGGTKASNALIPCITAFNGLSQNTETKDTQV